MDVKSQALAKMGTGKRVCTFRRNLTCEGKTDSCSWGVEIICEGRYAWGAKMRIPKAAGHQDCPHCQPVLDLAFVLELAYLGGGEEGLTVIIAY